MWQVLLAAAAAAGSGILAKKLINPVETEKPVSDFNPNDQESEQNDESLQPGGSIFPFNDAFEEKRDGEIFRFSSSQAEHEMKKKTGSKLRGLKKNGGQKRGKKSGSVEGGEKERERGNGSAKRISVCLKKRRTGKHVAGKCESCALKDNSFGWGVGIGIMYMMSTGKAEISRLNGTMDETSKIVQELKAEISVRKSSCNMLTSDAANEAEANKKHIEGSYSGPLCSKHGECARRLHMEEERPEILEMDKLEAELESELQKLPWCGTESSGSERREDVFEAETLTKEHHSGHPENSNFCQYGVLPDELDEKLSHLLIEQQGNQIVELEAELHQAHSKLQQKEAELQALKNCVKQLSEFSLASASDEETEKHEDVKIRDGIREKLELEPTKTTVGTKRTIGYESHVCSSE